MAITNINLYIYINAKALGGGAARACHPGKTGAGSRYFKHLHFFLLSLLFPIFFLFLNSQQWHNGSVTLLNAPVYAALHASTLLNNIIILWSYYTTVWYSNKRCSNEISYYCSSRIPVYLLLQCLQHYIIHEIFSHCFRM